jgi:phospholipid/cholesterol/gamma-HCH transport system ATP-binding protein
MSAPASKTAIQVRNLTMAYGDRVVMKDLNFTIQRGDIFIIMGGSGCGKSTLMRHLLGLEEPAQGEVFYGDQSFTAADPAERNAVLRRLGVMYQGGALFSSMTLAENIALPLSLYTKLSPEQIRRNATYKLALVGLAGFEDFYPAEISGGMNKRAAIARAMALDPEILFLDEPSAGLDPLSAARLDQLLKELRDQLQCTLVVVTHELASIFAIGTNGVFLDVQTKTLGAVGDPKELRDHSPDTGIRAFLNRGATSRPGAPAPQPAS